MNHRLDVTRFHSPIGPLALFADGDMLVGLEFADARSRLSGLQAHLEHYLGAFQTRERPDPAGAVSRLRAYFAGRLQVLEDQSVTMLGTPFQVAVWRQLRRIPPGHTISYATLAERVSKAGACRAVGAANGRNPVALFVPCHRVIAADGTLGGYGGGLVRKRRLLELEGALEPSLA